MSDIMEMVKQGYSISDIKEVYQIAKETNESEETGAEIKDKDTEEKETGAAAANAETPKVSDPETDSKGEDQTDYKKKYDELLKKYQQENIHADNSDKDVRTVEEKASDILAEMFGGKKDA